MGPNKMPPGTIYGHGSAVQGILILVEYEKAAADGVRARADSVLSQHSKCFSTSR